MKRYRSPEYIAWINMKDRCYNKAHKRYADYGGRGITVCERWRNSFQNFLEDMGRKPSPTHSLDRFPNNNGNYEPDNCRWATKTEQSLNQRKRNRKPAVIASKELGGSDSLVYQRLRYGWPIDLAKSAPIHTRLKTIKAQ